MPEHDEAADLVALLDFIRSHRGVDFGAYKAASLKRRLGKRMAAIGVESYAEYLDQLQASPDEFTPLLDTLFVNVTHFFRDPESWDVMRNVVLPRLLEEKGAESPIRVWCAGVATGEEPYSIAILLAEALGDEQFHGRVKIYATDIDEGSLGEARMATFTEQQLSDVPQELRERYFEASAGRYVFRGDLRRSMIFGRHNLLDDAPISRLDLLICRNTLMYFNREAQDRVLARFHFALREHGWLFLGNAEMLLTRRNLFTPIDARSRIFQKVTKHSLEERVALMDQTRADPGGEPTPLRPQLRDLVFDASPVPQIVVSRGGTIVLINATARQQFGLARQDEGRPLHELEISYRPVELRSLLDQLFVEGRPVSVHGVERHVSESRSQYHDVKLTPITDLRGSVIAATIVFVDVTHDHELRTELEHSRRDLELAYEELQSANEELETTNEELQSTIEELETTNEELQSTNEELETMNEELQSTNEELGAVNDELRERTEAITRLNAYMRSILNSARPGVIVVNEDLRVHLWNSRATDLWGLRPDEVENQPVLNLDIGLPIAELKDAMRACLRGEEDLEPLVLAAHDRRGKALQCRVTCAPLLGPGEDVSGVILMMEEWSGDGAGPEGGS